MHLWIEKAAYALIIGGSQFLAYNYTCILYRALIIIIYIHYL